MSGEAAGYYNAPSGPPPQAQNKEQFGGGYNQGNNQGYNQGEYTQQPPQYGMNNYGPQGYEATGQKIGFDQAFKIEKPKWNDWWAGLLFIATMGAFVVVSGIAIQGYSATYGFNGGGIYDSRWVQIYPKHRWRKCCDRANMGAILATGTISVSTRTLSSSSSSALPYRLCSAMAMCGWPALSPSSLFGSQAYSTSFSALRQPSISCLANTGREELCSCFSASSRCAYLTYCGTCVFVD